MRVEGCPMKKDYTLEVMGQVVAQMTLLYYMNRFYYSFIMKKTSYYIYMKNWCEHKDMKKYITQTHNPHFDKHHIKVPFRACIVGSSGSGKTSTLLSLISLTPDTFSKIVIVTKNKDEPLYSFLYDKTGGEDGILKILEPDKDGIPDINRELSPETNSLLVFDNLVNQT
jgi:hypothetical protein